MSCALAGVYFARRVSVGLNCTAKYSGRIDSDDVPQLSLSVFKSEGRNWHATSIVAVTGVCGPGYEKVSRAHELQLPPANTHLRQHRAASHTRQAEALVARCGQHQCQVGP